MSSASKNSSFIWKRWLLSLQIFGHLTYRSIGLVDYSTKFGDRCRNLCRKHLSTMQATWNVHTRASVTKEHRRRCWPTEKAV